MATHGCIRWRMRCRCMPIRKTSSSMNGPTNTKADTPKG